MNYRRYPESKTGAILLLLLSACGEAVGPRERGDELSYPGFDTSIYPGDAAIDAWAAGSPYGWVGYYLPAPCHRDTTWVGKRARLQSRGWGIAAIYVGQQTWDGVASLSLTTFLEDAPQTLSLQPSARAFAPGVTCSRTLLSREQGLLEATDAIARMQREGFAPGSTVYLDIERMESIPPQMEAYYRAWVEGVLRDGRYRPGIYAHTRNAAAIFAGAADTFRALGTAGAPRFWIATTTGFTRSSRPVESGHSFANVWQGILDMSETWNGVTLRIDVNVADRQSPSDP